MNKLSSELKIVLIALLSFSFNVHADEESLKQSSHQAKEKILWVKWNLQPEYIDAGPYKGQGYLDHFLEYVQDQLPEFEHESEFQTLNRLSLSWEKGNVCAVHIWLGYWPDKIVYSQPYTFTPRFGVVARKDSDFVDEFGEYDTVSLKDLLQNTDYRVGMLPLYYKGSKDSRYPLMAPLIEPYLGTSKVHEFSNSRNEVSVAYLDRNRVDYMIRQSITQASELKTKGLKDVYRFFYLEEGGRNKLVASACSNSALGKRVIAKVDQLIGPEFHKRYLHYRQQWDSSNYRYDKTFTDHFLNKIPQESVTE